MSPMKLIISKHFLVVLVFSLFTTTLMARTVKTGVEMLKAQNFAPIKGKRVGLITNPTGVDRNLQSTVDLFFHSKEFKLVALYGPEHGVRGDYSAGTSLSLIHISEPTRLGMISYAVFCLKKK